MSEDLKPTPKVAAGTITGALSVAILYIVTTAGLPMGPTEAGAFAVLFTAGGAYLKRGR